MPGILLLANQLVKRILRTYFAVRRRVKRLPAWVLGVYSPALRCKHFVNEYFGAWWVNLNSL